MTENSSKKSQLKLRPKFLLASILGLILALIVLVPNVFQPLLVGLVKFAPLHQRLLVPDEGVCGLAAKEVSDLSDVEHSALEEIMADGFGVNSGEAIGLARRYFFPRQIIILLADGGDFYILGTVIKNCLKDATSNLPVGLRKRVGIKLISRMPQSYTMKSKYDLRSMSELLNPERDSEVVDAWKKEFFSKVRDPQLTTHFWSAFAGSIDGKGVEELAMQVLRDPKSFPTHPGDVIDGKIDPRSFFSFSRISSTEGTVVELLQRREELPAEVLDYISGELTIESINIVLRLLGRLRFEFSPEVLQFLSSNTLSGDPENSIRSIAVLAMQVKYSLEARRKFASWLDHQAKQLKTKNSKSVEVVGIVSQAFGLLGGHRTENFILKSYGKEFIKAMQRFLSAAEAEFGEDSKVFLNLLGSYVLLHNTQDLADFWLNDPEGGGKSRVFTRMVVEKLKLDLDQMKTLTALLEKLPSQDIYFFVQKYATFLARHRELFQKDPNLLRSLNFKMFELSSSKRDLISAAVVASILDNSAEFYDTARQVLSSKDSPADEKLLGALVVFLVAPKDENQKVLSKLLDARLKKSAKCDHTILSTVMLLDLALEFAYGIIKNCSSVIASEYTIARKINYILREKTDLKNRLQQDSVMTTDLTLKKELKQILDDNIYFSQDSDQDGVMPVDGPVDGE